MMFESSGPMCFPKDESIIYEMLGYLNSCVAQYYLFALEPTIRYSEGTLLKVPYSISGSELPSQITADNISISKADWDSFEMSWEFKKHPFIREVETIEKAYGEWIDECTVRFNNLKSNEEELNRFFINQYGLADALDPTVNDEYVMIYRGSKRQDVISFISYAVGCMFGRYSLDEDGLAYAGGSWDVAKYSTFIPDTDNVIPITDEEYLEDDIVSRLCTWLKVVYGESTLEENLDFIAGALGNKGGSSREIIRNYFLNDFFKDHCQTYSVTGSGKRPIYWLFDSGKKNGFKCLIYMHRYQPDIIARIRTDYVHEQQERYRTQLTMLTDSLETAAASQRVKLNKQIAKIKDQALELQKYEEKIHHLADQMIEIDLDDGVKVNYAKFQDVLEKIK